MLWPHEPNERDG